MLVGEKHGEVIGGVHMLGNPPSSEIIYGACLAIEQEMTLKEMQEVVFPHPTVSEIFKEVVFFRFKLILFSEKSFSLQANQNRLSLLAVLTPLW